MFAVMVLSPLAMLVPSSSPKPLLFYSIYHRQLIDGFVPLKSCLHDRYDDNMSPSTPELIVAIKRFYFAPAVTVQLAVLLPTCCFCFLPM